MDVIGTTAAIVGIVDVLSRAILKLHDIHKQLQEANLTVSGLIGELTATKAALNELHGTVVRHADDEQHYDLVRLAHHNILISPMCIKSLNYLSRSSNSTHLSMQPTSSSPTSMRAFLNSSGPTPSLALETTTAPSPHQLQPHPWTSPKTPPSTVLPLAGTPVTPSLRDPHAVAPAPHSPPNSPTYSPTAKRPPASPASAASSSPSTSSVKVSSAPPSPPNTSASPYRRTDASSRPSATTPRPCASCWTMHRTEPV